MDRVHDLDGAVARAGQRLRRHTPDAGDVCARRRVGEAALARELVALLPVLAAALAITLAGDHDGVCAFASDIAGGECDRHDSLAVFYTLRLVLQAARVHQHGSPRLANPVRGSFD